MSKVIQTFFLLKAYPMHFAILIMISLLVKLRRKSVLLIATLTYSILLVYVAVNQFTGVEC